MFFDANRHERRLTPEILDGALNRWKILSRATDNEHAGTLSMFPDLFAAPRQEQASPRLPETFTRLTNGPVAGKVIDAAQLVAPQPAAEAPAETVSTDQLAAARAAAEQAYLPPSPEIYQAPQTEVTASAQPVVNPQDPMGTLVIPHSEQDERAKSLAEARQRIEEIHGTAA